LRPGISQEQKKGYGFFQPIQWATRGDAE
jgi:hypothetical protein